MSLTRQIHIYSVGTDAFYEEEEQQIHKRLLRLYKLRSPYEEIKKKRKKKKEIPKWRKASINRLLKKEKMKLSSILDQRLESTKLRILNEDVLRNKAIVSLFESSLTRALGIKPNEFSYDIMIVNVYFFQVFHNLVRDGFLFKGEKYIFLTASAGQIRTKRAVFIKESSYKKIQGRLMCGLTIDDINKAGGINPNKLLAYLALNNSATDVWENFDIDKTIVVDDFETIVEGEVDFIDDLTYQIERKNMGVPITHTDGCGMMLDKPTRMIRAPWVKGLLVYFPFDEFIQEKCPSGKCIVTDIYGDEHDILGEDIRYILTKSQFKLWKYYSSWEEYKQKFKENHCEVCYCNLEEQDRPPARINYQMLQTLSDITDQEIKRLVQKSVDEIETIGNDFETTMRLLGANEQNLNPNYFQKSLMIYPELFRDKYCREVLKQTKKSLVIQAKAGRLRINGRYRFVSPDLYAFSEYLFLGDMKPKGLLKNGEVYVEDFRDGDELACLRSPHLYREWPIRENRRNEEIDKWLGGTKCVYTSCFDTISKILQFDNDGDTLLVIKDKLLCKVAKRNMQGIVPLYYEMKKAKPSQINQEVLYKGMTQAYTTGNIGPISNNISKIWNSTGEIDKQELDAVKWLVMENNFVIDAAKTLYTPTRPKEVDKIIKQYTKSKLPNFFIYVKDKLTTQVEPSNESAMNRIAKQIPTSRIKFCKTVDKFDYRKMMNMDEGFTIQSDHQIIKSYEFWNTHQSLFNEQNEHVSDEDLFKYQSIRENIFKENKEYSKDYILNTLLMYLYTFKPNSTKKTLWASFGEMIYHNLEKNLEGNEKICPVCGKRFQPRNSLQRCCGMDCGKIYDIRMKKLNKN